MGHLVVQKVRVEGLAAIHDEVLGEGIAQPHLDRAFQLTFHGHVVDHRPAVVGRVHLNDLDLAGFLIHIDLGHLGAETEGRADQALVSGGIVSPGDHRLAALQFLHKRHRFAQAHATIGFAFGKHPATFEFNLEDRIEAEFGGYGASQFFLDLIGGIQYRVAVEEGQAAAPGAQVGLGGDGRVGGGNADIPHLQAQCFGQNLGHDGFHPLPDIRGHSEQVGGAVFEHLHFGGREVVLGIEPVEHAAGDEAVAADADALSGIGILANFIPVAHFAHFLEGFDETATADGGHAGQDVTGHLGVFQAQVDGIDPQILGGHVHLGLGGKQGLGRTESAHGRGWGLVGVHMLAQVAVVGIAVEHGAEVSGQETGRGAHGVVGAAIKIDVQILGHDRAVFFEADLGPDGHGMAPAAGHQLLFTGEGEFHRATGFLGHERRADFPGAQFHFAAKPATHSGLDDPDVIFSQIQRRGQQALNDIRRLGGGPDGDAAFLVCLGHAGAGFHVGVALGLDRERVLADVIRFGEGFVQIAVFNFAIDTDIGFVPVVKERRVSFQRTFDVIDTGQFFVLDLDQFDGRLGNVRVHCRHGGHFIADIANLVDGQGILVLGFGKQPPVAGGDLGQIRAGDDQAHAGQGSGLAGIDVDNAGVGQRATEQFAVEHTGKFDIVGIYGLSGRFGLSVGSGNVFSDDIERFHGQSFYGSR
ncbi:hypothetical protein DESC_870033 [Desulfosarcina cetonica]|nr:hypothetical protein DESC_870033 [Desulfosarcina cetonica]